MVGDEQRFVRFALEGGYLSPEQVRQLIQRQKELAQQGAEKSLMSLATEIFQWSNTRRQEILRKFSGDKSGKTTRVSGEEIEKTYSTAGSTFDGVEQAPPEFREDLAMAMEMLIRGIASIDDINRCLKEKYESRESLSFSQVMVRKRILTIENFLSIKNDLEQWSEEQLKERLGKAIKVVVRTAGGVPALEQKSGFEKIGRYQILREIGRGGMGVVYAARDENLGKIVAMKVLPPGIENDSVELERFEREARLAASLDHPGIVAVHDVGVDKNIHYFTMDYVDGLPLSEYVDKMNCGLKKIASLMKDVAEALSYAHSHHIIHRDLKPANILVDTMGMPRITDFGLARNVKEGKNLTMSGAILGTPAYMPPEQAAGKFRQVNRQSDIYSLGAVLYHLLVGRPPFIGASLAKTISAVLEQDPIPPRKLVKGMPRDLEIICLKCLEKDPGRRYLDAKALAADLGRFLEGEIVRAKPSGTFYKIQRWAVRNKALSALFLVVTGVGIALGYFLLWLPGTLTVTVKTRKIDKDGHVKFMALDAQFAIDGRATKGPRHKFSLAPGYHKIVIQAPDHDPLEFYTKISPGKVMSVEKVLLHRQGRVTITSAVSGIEATFTNQDSGETQSLIAPLYEYPMDTGTYLVALRKENYFARQTTIAVAAGQTCESHAKLEPMLLWRKEISDKADVNSVFLADLDCDGRPEIICTKVTGSIVCWDLDRSEKRWHIDRQLPILPHRTAFKDMNRDGVPDLLSAHPDRFTVIDGKTRGELFKLPSWWSMVFATGDANEDGYEDLILFRHYGHGIECYDMKTGSLLWKRPMDIRIYTDPVFVDKDHLIYACAGQLHQLDIRTGNTEPVYRFDDKDVPKNIALLRNPADRRAYLLWYITGKGLHSLDFETRSLAWRSEYPTLFGSGIVLCDLEEDGKSEILLHLDRLYCVDAASGKQRWAFNTGGGPLPRCADLDGDGSNEVVAASTQGMVYAVNGQGALIDKFSLETSVGLPLLADIDGDAMLEILCPSSKYLYCIRHRPEEKIRIFDDAPQMAADCPATCDFDGDGHKEIIVGHRGGDVYCRDGKTGRVWWRYQSGLDVTSPIAVADINGDSIPDVVVPANTRAIALSSRGEKMWERELEGTQAPNVSVQIVDLDGSGAAEVLVKTVEPDNLYCLKGATGEIIWHKQVGRIATALATADIDGDSCPEIFFLSDRERSLYCLNGKNGEAKWPAPATLPMHANGREMAMADIDQDGQPEILAPQSAGQVSCLLARDGRVLWNTRVPGGTIVPKPLIGDFDGDRKIEVIVGTVDEDIYCLDALTGEIEWGQALEKTRSSAYQFDMASADLDGDGLPDIITTGSFHSLCFFSGKDGSYLGHLDKFGLVQSPLQLLDLDGDNQLDMLFVDSDSRLISIYNAVAYCRRVIHTTRRVEDPLVAISRIHTLFRYRAFSLIEREMSAWQDIPGWAHVREFYQGVCALARGETDRAIEHFRKSERTPADIPDNKFLLAIALLGKDKQAPSLLHDLAARSILEFDRCHSRYRSLLTGEAEERLRKILPALVRETKCDVALDKAYAYASFMGSEEEKKRLLGLSLKYGLPTTPNYEGRYRLYLENTYQALGEKITAYNLHEGLDIMDEALDKLPLCSELLANRADIYVRTQISPKQALADLDLALSINPGQAQALLIRGKLRYESRLYQEALRDFKQCAAQTPGPGEAHLYKPLTLLAIGKRDKALKEIEAAEKLWSWDPQNADCYLLRALKFLAQGKRAEAFQEVQTMTASCSRCDPWLVRGIVGLLQQR